MNKPQLTEELLPTPNSTKSSIIEDEKTWFEDKLHQWKEEHKDDTTDFKITLANNDCNYQKREISMSDSLNKYIEELFRSKHDLRLTQHINSMKYLSQHLSQQPIAIVNNDNNENLNQSIKDISANEQIIPHISRYSDSFKFTNISKKKARQKALEKGTLVKTTSNSSQSILLPESQNNNRTTLNDTKLKVNKKNNSQSESQWRNGRYEITTYKVISKKKKLYQKNIIQQDKQKKKEKNIKQTTYNIISSVKEAIVKHPEKVMSYPIYTKSHARHDNLPESFENRPKYITQKMKPSYSQINLLKHSSFTSSIKNDLVSSNRNSFQAPCNSRHNPSAILLRSQSFLLDFTGFSQSSGQI